MGNRIRSLLRSEARIERRRVLRHYSDEYAELWSGSNTESALQEMVKRHKFEPLFWEWFKREIL